MELVLDWIRGFWTETSGARVTYDLRTDAYNLITTARTTNPEQRETIHMIAMMRHDSQQGAWDDFNHMPTQHVLADCFTKTSGDPKQILWCIHTGWIKSMDLYPPFRTTVRVAF